MIQLWSVQIVMRDAVTKKPRGFGFITFKDAAVAETVCREQHVLDGRQVGCSMVFLEAFVMSPQCGPIKRVCRLMPSVPSLRNKSQRAKRSLLAVLRLTLWKVCGVRAGPVQHRWLNALTEAALYRPVPVVF